MNDDQLVRQFLKSNIRVPEDKGFSQRVMSRLPQRPINMTWVTIVENIVLAVGIVLLLARVDWLQMFCDASIHILQFIAYIRYVDFTINPLYIIVALVLLTVWSGNKIKSLI